MVENLDRDATAGSEPLRGRAVAARRARWIVTALLAAVLASALWVVLTASPSGAGPGRSVRLLTVDRNFPAGGRYPSDPYIGPRVCAECHPGESALHARSGHARTLRPAGRRALARSLDGTTIADPEHPDILWSYQFRDGQLHIRRTARGDVEERVAEYAFGSGLHATTFVNVLDPEIPSILEHRITYYAQRHALGLTPGQNDRARPGRQDSMGVTHPPHEARKCFGCHSTQASRAGRAIDEATLIPNVSCERCHGPGRAHVDAARRGAAASELELPFGPGRYTAEGLLMLCGTCHRHPSKARPGQIRPDDPQLARFQPVGTIESRCFRESRGAFSCVTCHDPHARASKDRGAYLAVCLSCHLGAAPDESRPAPHPRDPPSAAPAAGGHPCPVAPRGDCVDCHMPRVDAGQHVLFTDHWIRVRRPGESPGPLRGPHPDLRLLDTPDP